LPGQGLRVWELQAQELVQVVDSLKQPDTPMANG